VKRKFRLTRTADFKRVRRFGKSYAHPLVVLISSPNSENVLHIGVTASRSVGGAVERNRAKRRMRAALQAIFPAIKPGWDLIFLARQPLLTTDFKDIQAAFFSLLSGADLLVKEGNDRQQRLSE